MTEQQQRDLAERLADVSSVFDFETALRLVQFNPAEAESLIRLRREGERRQAVLAQAHERLRAAAREFR